MVTADVQLDMDHPFVEGLAAAGLPLLYLDHDASAPGWAAALAALATGTSGAVAVIGDKNHIQGLERPVLIHLTYGQSGEGAVAGASTQGVGWDSRLHALSRCTTQLVLVTPDPPAPSALLANSAT